MFILKHVNKLFLFSSLLIFVYIFFLLISSISSGFDITDESYYILHAQYQNDVYQVIRRDGYYTGILYFFSNGNLALHRLFGILILVGVSLWFAIELCKYISKYYVNNK